MILSKTTKRGFTLIELLLGLAIFSMIAVVVYSVFSSGIAISRRSEGRVESYRDGRMAVELISRELENMVDYDFSASYKDKKAFIGKSDQISFILPVDGKLKWVTYTLVPIASDKIFQTIIGQTTKKNVTVHIVNERKAQSYTLVRDEADFAEYLSGDDTDGKGREIVCGLVNPDGLQFSFGFVEGEETVTYSWKDEWNLPGIPANVHVELETIDPEKENGALSFVQNILVPHGVQGKSEDK